MARLARQLAWGLLALWGGPGVWPLCGAAAAERTMASAIHSITSAELRHHVDTLASDTMEGREAGTRGGRAAAGYLIQLLQEMQLDGGGDDGRFYQSFGNGYRNILAMVEGRDPELKHEFLVIGAHYDHVGYGSRRDSFGPIGFIHNGADDNASGTATLAEVAQAFTLLPSPPRRSILFAWWDGEEKGLLGSKHWMAHPTIERQSVTLAFNLDMVGRFHDRPVEVYGSRTAAGLRRIVSLENTSVGLPLDFTWKLEANSDHYTFFKSRIPFLMFHTGLHADYHRPSDDAEKVNGEGMQRIARLLFRVAEQLADMDTVPTFRDRCRYESNDNRRRLETPFPSDPPRLGVSWEQSSPGNKMVISFVEASSPAERAGLRVGDQIVRFDGRLVRDGDEFQQLVLAAGRTTVTRVLRAGHEDPLDLPLTLRGSPSQVGIRWQEDSAQPSVVVLNQVIGGSVAEVAGLGVGDRIYAVDGKRFADGEAFRRLVTRAARTIELSVEREGRLRIVTLHFLLAPSVTAPAE